MKPTLPKDVTKKIRKFVETVESLKSGKDTYFSITRLTSIKSLCKDPQTAAHFVFFLAERTLEKAESNSKTSHRAERVPYVGRGSVPHLKTSMIPMV